VTTVCRFLALLELFREGAVAFDQMTPLGELTIRWTGTDDGEIEVSDEFDELVDPAAEASDLDAPDEAGASDLGAPDEEPDSADLAGEDDGQPRYDADAVGAAGADATPGPNEMVADQ
jgi:segregation and condensation protein A